MRSPPRAAAGSTTSSSGRTPNGTANFTAADSVNGGAGTSNTLSIEVGE